MIEKTISFLEEGKTILYPTDTVWGIGCDATNEKAVQKVYTIKERETSKSLIILVDSLKMVQNYVFKIPQKVLEILKNSEKPTTIIYEGARNLAPNTIGKDKTIAIRIVQDEFCKKVIQKFGKPIVSTSANISGKPTPKSYAEISQAILNTVDYVVDLQQDKIADKSSTILKIEGNNIIVIRE
jgi:L-threonylcarbamoyladenylate synthase